MIYELRIYHCVPGRLPDLLKRFDTITLPLWEKHRIRQAGFWTVAIGPSNQDLYYLLQWESLDEVILRTYSLVGLRADVDFMLWRIAFDPLCFQSTEAAIRRSRLGAYLSQAHSYLSLQRRSPYVNKMKGAGEGVER